jgi:hypothetical protein
MPLSEGCGSTAAATAADAAAAASAADALGSLPVTRSLRVAGLIIIIMTS